MEGGELLAPVLEREHPLPMAVQMGEQLLEELVTEVEATEYLVFCQVGLELGE